MVHTSIWSNIWRTQHGTTGHHRPNIDSTKLEAEDNAYLREGEHEGLRRRGEQGIRHRRRPSDVAGDERHKPPLRRCARDKLMRCAFGVGNHLVGLIVARAYFNGFQMVSVFLAVLLMGLA